MNNKDMAIRFLQTAALGNPREAYDHFVGSDFIHHNQCFTK